MDAAHTYDRRLDFTKPIVALDTDGVCVKLVTRPGETLPGVYVEDRSRNVLQTMMLDGSCESHFQGRCQECEV